MNKNLGFLGFTIFIILITIISGFELFTNSSNNESNIISPIPNFLNILDNKQVSGINIWQFFLNDNLQKKNQPNITAKSALIYDITSDKVLYDKNAKEKLPMASLTKIMTAIIALENPKKNDKYSVDEKDLVGEDSMGLTNGESLSLKELLYGLMLNSGNDAAETLASNFKNGRVSFIKAMNDKAKSLGLKDTNFTNPTGLEGDGQQYTTAYDLTVISKYALDNFPLFKEVVSTFDFNIESSKNHKAFYLENETNLLTSYPGVEGIKTGFTPEAGLCLVTYLDYSGHKILGVILGSDDRRGEMIELLDYSLESISIKPPKHG
ncbi:MAG TPA: D-alanyl-D-alanine carboxypeptidase family protein [Candidatus Sulfotelmatobacter sp.]|nr:D-alanyl-D-alanine carboxypeptidase family protein [Candidatus Sulfotelmatobacter sp.]